MISERSAIDAGLPRPRDGLTPAGRVASSVLLAVLGFVGWTVLLHLPLFVLSPAAALPCILLVAAAFYWRNLRIAGGRTLRTAVLFRLRRPNVSAAWLVAAVVAILTLGMGQVGLAHYLIGNTPPDADPAWVEQYLSGGGRFVFLLVVGLLGPMLEELYFRGRIQRTLERSFGPVAAIATTAAAFALLHPRAPALMIGPLLSGVILGAAVYLTRSVWTGVLLHAAWNTWVLAFGEHLPLIGPLVRGEDPRPVAALVVLATGAAALGALGWQVRARERSARIT